MKTFSKNAPLGEALVMRLITLVLGTYAVALIAQTVGVINLV
jgi:hypothetical protein